MVDQWNDILDVLGGMTLFFFSFSSEGEMKSLTMTIIVIITNYQMSGSRGSSSLERVPCEADQ